LEDVSLLFGCKNKHKIVKYSWDGIMFTEAAVEILINNWPMLFIFLTIVVSLRLAYIYVNKIKFILYKELLSLGFVVYILSLFYAVTFQDVSWSTSNFVPFREILRYEILTPKFFKNVLGNIIVFIPYGFYVSYLLKSKKVRMIFFLSLLTSVSIESTQFMIGRVFDVDDIILNVVGGVLGYLIYRLLEKIKNRLPKLINNEYIYNFLALFFLLFILWYFISHILNGVSYV
jgi:glycopeptide antibiotics resistance protein